MASIPPQECPTIIAWSRWRFSIKSLMSLVTEFTLTVFELKGSGMERPVPRCSTKIHRNLVLIDFAISSSWVYEFPGPPVKMITGGRLLGPYW